jgi:hypothetical protein
MHNAHSLFAANLMSDRSLATSILNGFCNAGEAVLLARLANALGSRMLTGAHGLALRRTQAAREMPSASHGFVLSAEMWPAHIWAARRAPR